MTPAPLHVSKPYAICEPGDPAVDGAIYRLAVFVADEGDGFDVWQLDYEDEAKSESGAAWNATPVARFKTERDAVAYCDANPDNVEAAAHEASH